MTVFLRLLEYARPYRGRLATALVAMLVYGAASLGVVVMVVGSAVVAFGVGGIPIARRWLGQWSSGVERTARDVKDEAHAQSARAPETTSMPEPTPMPEAPPLTTPRRPARLG